MSKSIVNMYQGADSGIQFGLTCRPRSDACSLLGGAAKVDTDSSNKRLALDENAVHVWEQIQTKARTLLLAEPLLSRSIQRVVLDQPSLWAAISAVLAGRLADQDMGQRELYELLQCAPQLKEATTTECANDMRAVMERDPSCGDYLHILLNLKGFHALQVHRVSHLLWNLGRRSVAFALAARSSNIFCVDIHPAAKIGSGVMFDHGTAIVVGETTVIDDDVSLLQGVTLGGTGKELGDRHPKIRQGCMIGAGATILGNISIGANSKIAAGSVVIKTVPPHCTVAGVPGRVVRMHDGQKVPAEEMDQSI